MNISPVVLAVDNLTSGNITEQDITALAGVFREYLEDDAAPITILSGGCPQGLRAAVRNSRRRRHIYRALDLLDSPACSIKSVADLLAKDMLRLATRGKPRNDYESELVKAIESHPSAAITAEALWFVVREYRHSK